MLSATSGLSRRFRHSCCVVANQGLANSFPFCSTSAPLRNASSGVGDKAAQAPAVPGNDCKALPRADPPPPCATPPGFPRTRVVRMRMKTTPRHRAARDSRDEESCRPHVFAWRMEHFDKSQPCFNSAERTGLQSPKHSSWRW
jgi:hypothetical protein